MSTEEELFVIELNINGCFKWAVDDVEYKGKKKYIHWVRPNKFNHRDLLRFIYQACNETIPSCVWYVPPEQIFDPLSTSLRLIESDDDVTSMISLLSSTDPYVKVYTQAEIDYNLPESIPKPTLSAAERSEMCELVKGEYDKEVPWSRWDCEIKAQPILTRDLDEPHYEMELNV